MYGNVRACPRALGCCIFMRKTFKARWHAFMSTINRNIKAYLFAVIGAEYILKLLPRGTHDYEKFIKPSELISWCRQQDLTIVTLKV